MKKNFSDKPVDSQSFTVTAITIGGSLEWYEIGIFIFWPLLIEKRAIGFDMPLVESLKTGTIFLLAAFALANGAARAFGGWFFGKKGDKQGRRIAFPLTLLIATLPSWILVLLSFFISYGHWFAYSPLIFALVKFFQGVPAGGELPGAICYLAETANNIKSRKYLCSFSLLGPQIGLALSSIICLILSASFSKGFLLEHAWRYVFMFSGLLGIGGYMMRKKIHETTEYLNFKQHHKIIEHPLKLLASKYLFKMLLAAILSIFEIVTFSIISVIPYYYSQSPFNLNNNMITILALAYSLLCATFLPFIGFLASRIVSFPWLKTSVWGIISSSPILLWTLVEGHFVFSIFLNILLIFFLSIQGAILPSVLAEIFPVSIRYTGIAFSFNILDGMLWTAFTGICFLFLKYNSLAFILILPFVAIIFLIGVKISRSDEKIYKLLQK